MKLPHTDGRSDVGGKLVVVTVALLAIFSVETEHVYAYIDPGTGSLLYQTAIATVLGVGILLRSNWRSIVRVFGAVFKGHPPDPGAKARTDSK